MRQWSGVKDQQSLQVHAGRLQEAAIAQPVIEALTNRVKEHRALIKKLREEVQGLNVEKLEASRSLAVLTAAKEHSDAHARRCEERLAKMEQEKSSLVRELAEARTLLSSQDQSAREGRLTAKMEVQEEMAAMAAMAAKATAELEKKLASRDGEVASLRAEHDAAEATWQAKEAEGAAGASAAAASAREQLESARLERVAAVGAQIVRRIMSRDLSIGFSSWVEMWSAKTRALDKLRQVAHTLRAPELANTFFDWSVEASEDKRNRERFAREKDIQRLFAQLRESEAEVQRLRNKVKDQQPATSKFSKSARLQRAQEAKNAKARMGAGEAAAKGDGTMKAVMEAADGQ